MWKMIFTACAVLLVLSGASRAQVISGESTYEDNYEHVPSPEAQANASKAAPGEPRKPAATTPPPEHRD